MLSRTSVWAPGVTASVLCVFRSKEGGSNRVFQGHRERFGRCGGPTNRRHRGHGEQHLPGHPEVGSIHRWQTPRSMCWPDTVSVFLHFKVWLYVSVLSLHGDVYSPLLFSCLLTNFHNFCFCFLSGVVIWTIVLSLSCSFRVWVFDMKLFWAELLDPRVSFSSPGRRMKHKGDTVPPLFACCWCGCCAADRHTVSRSIVLQRKCSSTTFWADSSALSITINSASSPAPRYPAPLKPCPPEAPALQASTLPACCSIVRWKATTLRRQTCPGCLLNWPLCPGSVFYPISLSVLSIVFSRQQRSFASHPPLNFLLQHLTWALNHELDR